MARKYLILLFLLFGGCLPECEPTTHMDAGDEDAGSDEDAG